MNKSLDRCKRILLLQILVAILFFPGWPAMAASPGTHDVLLVTTTADAGEGSLREAILKANARKGPDTIRFDSLQGPFATPQTIPLAGELPEPVGELTIDGYIEGRLWQPSGVTLSGGNRHRVLAIPVGSKVTLASVTVAGGYAEQGGGILNRGELVVKNVTFLGNSAQEAGGALANLGGNLTLINSTFHRNKAGNSGGGLADESGTTTVTNCTFAANSAPKAGGIYSSGALLLRNTILAKSAGNLDCQVEGTLKLHSTHNLIQKAKRCGTPISTSDPRLEELGSYNGPTQTLALGAGSPAINAGHNPSALDEKGQPLRWDQRGGGDPRFVAGITDIGAFEYQAFPHLVVDTTEDNDLRACTKSGQSDCSLRGAITLANAMGGSRKITFDHKAFPVPVTLRYVEPLPHIKIDITLAAGKNAKITLKGPPHLLRKADGGNLSLTGVEVIED